MSAYTSLPGSILQPFSSFVAENATGEGDQSNLEQNQPHSNKPVAYNYLLRKQKSFRSGMNLEERTKPSLTRRRSFHKPVSSQSIKTSKASKKHRRGIPKSNNLHLIVRGRSKTQFKASLSSVVESDVSLEATLKHANYKDKSSFR